MNCNITYKLGFKTVLFCIKAQLVKVIFKQGIYITLIMTVSIIFTVLAGKSIGRVSLVDL